MIIPIDDKYRISSDTNCWRIEQFKPASKNTEERWTPKTYHTDFKDAKKALTKQLVREIETSTLADALEAVENLSDKLSLALSTIDEGCLSGASKNTEK